MRKEEKEKISRRGPRLDTPTCPKNVNMSNDQKGILMSL